MITSSRLHLPLSVHRPVALGLARLQRFDLQSGPAEFENVAAGRVEQVRRLRAELAGT